MQRQRSAGDRPAVISFENEDLIGIASGGRFGPNAKFVSGGKNDDTLIGTDDKDTLDGKAGADTLIGLKGDDTYIVDNLLDKVTENALEGTDTVKTSAAIADTTNFANVENFTFTGKGFWNFTGNDLDNVITGGASGDTLIGGKGIDTLNGGAGDDTLDGGIGADKLVGGAGNDTYIVDDLNDQVIDSGGSFDAVGTTALITTAAAGIEVYAYVGSGNWTFTANDLNNTLSGGSGNDHLIGGKGNDLITGFVGDDTLEGGLGNDSYNIEAGDTVIESAKGGIDLIHAYGNINLLTDAGLVNQEIENLWLHGGTNATGNNLANVITGALGLASTLSGADGNDTLNGAESNDTLNGDGGNDTLNGGDGDDRLDGGAGNDIMIGGDGLNTYVVDSLGDKVKDLFGGGSDIIESSISFKLATAPNVFNLVLTGAANVNGTGGAGFDHIEGNDGNNILDGGKANDIAAGGKGDDTYIFDLAAEGDKQHIIEALNEGNDTAKTAVQAFSTAINNVENYIYTGTGIWSFTGNDLNNAITGSGGGDFLDGGIGADVIDGGKGKDTMTGGAGDDTFFVDNVGDTITDGQAAETLFINRKIDLATDAKFGGIFDNGGLTGTAALNITGNGNTNKLFGNDGANTIDGGAGADTMTGKKGNDVYIIDNAGDKVIEAIGGGIDTVKSADIAIDLTSAGFLNQDIENVTLEAGLAILAIGNALNNVIIGNDNGVQLIGGDGDDKLTGGTSADELFGDAGKDTMTGGKGDDAYHVDDPGDKVVETLNFAAGGGTDTVASDISFSLATRPNVENLFLFGPTTHDGTDTAALNGTGNALVNLLIGNAGNNVLDGGKGVDIFNGGAGDDTYVIDVTDERAKITDSSGSDTIKTALALTVADIVAGIENYTYTGSKAWTFDLSSETGVAHALTGGSGADILTGADKNDRIDGGKGADTMTGGAGNDTFVVDNANDEITDGTASDTLLINHALDLVNDAKFGGIFDNGGVTGTAALNVTGNGNANTLFGNDGNNVLSGLAGADTLIGGNGDDTLTGGADKDTFAYRDIAERGTGKDAITDFSKADGDVLDISALFTGAGPTDVADAFASGFLLVVNIPGKGNTVVAVDTDGGGDDFVLLVTLKAVGITAADTASFDVT